MTTEVKTDEARQGRRGRRVLIILVAGLALAVAGAVFMGLIDDDSVTDNIGAPGVEPVPEQTETN